tara:strand:+ start:1354 stop:1530 length:177 start_codon:yes stop_codon:yes gene_type:complete
MGMMVQLLIDEDEEFFKEMILQIANGDEIKAEEIKEGLFENLKAIIRYGSDLEKDSIF